MCSILRGSLETKGKSLPRTAQTLPRQYMTRTGFTWCPGYLDLILDICRKENVDGVFSLIDPELSLLAKEKERFLEVGAKPVISSCELVETCFDKYKMYQMLCGMGIPTGKCYVGKEEFSEALRNREIS